MRKKIVGREKGWERLWIMLYDLDDPLHQQLLWFDSIGFPSSISKYNCFICHQCCSWITCKFVASSFIQCTVSDYHKTHYILSFWKKYLLFTLIWDRDIKILSAKKNANFLFSQLYYAPFPNIKTFCSIVESAIKKK